MAQTVQQIAVSSCEQLAGMDQIGNAMESIDEAARQVEQAAQDLDKPASELSDIVKEYQGS